MRRVTNVRSPSQAQGERIEKTFPISKEAIQSEDNDPQAIEEKEEPLETKKKTPKDKKLENFNNF